MMRRTSPTSGLSRSDRLATGFIVALATLVALVAGWNVGSSLWALATGVAPTAATPPEHAALVYDTAHGTVWFSGIEHQLASTSAGELALQLTHAGFIAGQVAVLAVAIMAGYLAVLILRGAPFTRALSGVVGGAGIAVMVGGLGNQLLTGLAELTLLEAARPLAADHQLVLPAWSLELDLSVVGVGFLLALVATAFQLGQRMQRDTQGLV